MDYSQKHSHFTRDIPVGIVRHEQNDLSFHSHEFHELVVVTSGTGEHFTGDGGRYKIHSGDIFLIRPLCEHGYANTSGLKILNILYFPEYMSFHAEDLIDLPGYHAFFSLASKNSGEGGYKNRISVPHEDILYVEMIIKNIETELKNQQAGCRYMVMSYFAQLTGFVSRAYSEQPDKAGRPLFRIGRTISHMEKNFEKNITLDELCGIANMSKSTLIRAFKKSLDITPLDYLLKLRINKSTELLRKNETSIEAVSDSCGFNDSNYFSRQFKKINGISPSEYRKTFTIMSGG